MLRGSAGLLVLAALAGCAALGPDPRRDMTWIDEAWVSVSTPKDNIDSVAAWRTPEGKLLVIATAKTGDALRVYDGDDGTFLRSVGGPGTGSGQLERPNGVFVIDDLAFVVERDNHRVQVFDLRRNEPIGTFGDAELRLPYGLWIDGEGGGRYSVYVTDNYETADEQVPPDAELGERVKRFDVEVRDGRLSARMASAFGETAGEGRLRRVESIWGDPAHGRLLVADEDESRQDIKIYDFDGRFTGTLMGAGVFLHEPEGIALVDCGGGEGYWIVSDQHTPRQIVRIFDRESLRLLASFAPRVTHTVDGIWFEPSAGPRFARGALFSQHDDAAVSAFDWQAISSALGLRSDCPVQVRAGD